MERLNWNLDLDDKTIVDKINELVNTVNTIQKERGAEQFKIQGQIGILNAVCKSVKIHKKQIDELQARISILEEFAHPTAKTPADPEEQRKWIGKLCRFWDDGCVSNYISLLKQIDDDELPFADDKGEYWEHCEPIKPDDDIIYKGE